MSSDKIPYINTAVSGYNNRCVAANYQTLQTVYYTQQKYYMYTTKFLFKPLDFQFQSDILYSSVNYIDCNWFFTIDK